MTEYPPPPPQSPQPPYAPQPMSQSDERLWATLAHAGVILFWFVAPLVIWLVFRERSAFVNDQAKEALNWSILMTIAYVVGILTLVFFIGILIIIAAGIAVLVFGILAAIAANKGEQYRYPFNWRIIK